MHEQLVESSEGLFFAADFDDSKHCVDELFFVDPGEENKHDVVELVDRVVQARPVREKAAAHILELSVGVDDLRG